tara:strand:+ start:188 stop:706 length:519 start_codon:yes stop_codon:yes gene_type:complete
MQIRKDKLETIIREELKTYLIERDTKKRCIGKSGKGSINPFHSSDGRFSSQKNAASYSVRDGSGECTKGQNRENPYRWTKVKCGREDPSSADTKAKYKCKDGSKVGSSSVDESDTLQILTDAQINELAKLDAKKVRKFCNQRGNYSMKDLMVYINNLARAEKGDLFKSEKND